MPLKRELTDQRSEDLSIKGGHHRCPSNEYLLISGSQTCLSRVGTTDALDLRDYQSVARGSTRLQLSRPHKSNQDGGTSVSPRRGPTN
jgi:hypothetical protein